MKKLWTLILSLCMLISFTGCSGLQKELLEEMSKTNSWDAIEISQTGNMTLELMGEKMTIGMESQGYTNSKDLTGYVTTKMSDPTGIMALPEMKMYIDGGKTYINKDYFEQTYILSGMPVPRKLAAIDADYIGIADINSMMGNMTSMIGTTDFNAKTYELYEKIGKEMGIDLAVKKEGNSYIIQLDGKMLGEMVAKFMDPKNMVKYLEIMKDTLGIDLTAFVGEIEETDVAQMQESIDLIKELLVQSKVIVKYTITDKEFKQDVQMDFVLGEGMNMSMDLVSTSKKVAPKEVKIPEKRVDLSMEEYMGLMTPSGVLVDLTTGQIMNMAQGMTQEVKIIKVIKEAEEIYVPFKAVVTALGHEMDYNEKTKEVILVQDGKDVVVKVVLKDNTSYISVTELQNQGFNVTVEGTSLIILD